MYRIGYYQNFADVYLVQWGCTQGEASLHRRPPPVADPGGHRFLRRGCGEGSRRDGFDGMRSPERHDAVHGFGS